MDADSPHMGVNFARRITIISPLGGADVTLEADEAHIGRDASKKLAGPGPQMPVFSLVERGGKVRSFHVANVTAKNLHPMIARHASPASNLMTDESNIYVGIGWNFASHENVCQSAKEYVRGEAHTNTIEGYFSILKRGIYGVYQHVSEAHLKRYLAEFDFRYNNRVKLGVDDVASADKALDDVVGKRLLSTMGACRETITREMARMEVGGPLYYSASTVLAAIDGFALVLTGRRDFFHLHGHRGQRYDDAIPGTCTEPVMIRSGNLFANVATNLSEEEIMILAELPGARIERIVSTGKASPPGFWYDQDRPEWVVLLAGSAGLLIEGEDAPRVLRPGGYVEIPQHVRHRVEWTDADPPTVWLAIHSGRFND